MKRFIDNISELPVAVSGLALGLAGIEHVIKLETSNRLFGGLGQIAFILIILVAIKKLSHPKLLLAELSHPMNGCFIPTFDMTLMIMADSLAQYHQFIGRCLWCGAIVLHILFSVYFFYHRIRNFELKHIVPCWFLPPAGIAIACLNNKYIHLNLIAHSMFYVGLITYLVMAPIIFYCLIKRKKTQVDDLPLFTLLEAPPSLCLMSYLVGFNQHSHLLVNILLVITVSMIILVYVVIFRINPLKIKFYPMYCAFTFSMAISAGAIIAYSKYLGLKTNIGHIWHIIGLIEMIIAICVIAWVFVNMIPIINRIIFR